MALRNRDARADALRSVSIFSGMTKTDLRLIASHTDVVDRPAGTVICEQGRMGMQLVCIASGAADVTRDGKRVARLGEGDVIGELSLIDGGAASATVTLTQDSHLLVMSIQDFQSVMADSPTFHLKLLKALAHKLREADAALVA